MDYKKKFIELLESTVKDSTDEVNVNNLINHLDHNGFFKAPCSGAYHLAEEGGLVKHSVNVAKVADDIAQELGFLDLSSVRRCSLLHDVGKMGQFGKPNYVENILKTTGKMSTSKPYVSNKDLMYVPHEIRSIHIVSQFINLTEEENFAILHHNGMYGDLKYTLSGKETPLQMILHFADMWASRVVEVK